MDENKRKVLDEIGYRIGPCCGLCEHSRAFNREGFSTCAVNTYVHLKHQERRELSVTQYGRCPKFSPMLEVSVKLHGFNEFVE